MKRLKRGLLSKYILVFSLITVLSFAALGISIASMIRTYADRTQQETLQNCAASVEKYLNNAYNDANTVDINNYVFKEKHSIQDSLRLLADNYEHIHIMILDPEGKVLCTSENYDRKLDGRSVPTEELERLLATNGASVETNFGGLLREKEYLSVVKPITDQNGTLVGCVAVSTSSEASSTLLHGMIKTIAVFFLWILLASVVAIYFLTERIISPLRQISQAAKEYAAGNFDVRIPVKGNDEIADVAIAFNNMANTMSGLETQRSAFLANIAHDLRTPMTTIAGFTDGILAGAIPPEKQPYYLELVSSEVRRLSRLVSSLLDITRIQAGERKFTDMEFDICEMARQILISFEKQIDEKKLNVEFETDADSMTVVADRDAIHQVLYNICHNAVKFSRPGGLYRITIQEKNKKVLVCVYNEGDGIPAADLPYVFDRFYKSDKSRGLDKTGVGLGLYIVKTIINAHKEEIWADSEEGKYCAFTFTFRSGAEK